MLELDRSLTPAYWLNIADRSIPFVAAIEHTNFVPPEHYGGSHLVYLSNYLDREDRLYSLGHDELLAEYVPHLRRLNPDFEESWIKASHYHREDAAQPVNRTGYASGIPAHRTPIPSLYLANTTQIYPEDRGTNYSVRLGRKVARLAALGLRACRHRRAAGSRHQGLPDLRVGVVGAGTRPAPILL